MTKQEQERMEMIRTRLSGADSRDDLLWLLSIIDKQTERIEKLEKIRKHQFEHANTDTLEVQNLQQQHEADQRRIEQLQKSRDLARRCQENAEKERDSLREQLAVAVDTMAAVGSMAHVPARAGSMIDAALIEIESMDSGSAKTGTAPGGLTQECDAPAPGSRPESTHEIGSEYPEPPAPGVDPVRRTVIDVSSEATGAGFCSRCHKVKPEGLMGIDPRAVCSCERNP